LRYIAIERLSLEAATREVRPDRSAIFWFLVSQNVAIEGSCLGTLLRHSTRVVRNRVEPWERRSYKHEAQAREQECEGKRSCLRVVLVLIDQAKTGKDKFFREDVTSQPLTGFSFSWSNQFAYPSANLVLIKISSRK
jgi:hypothetical protein